MGQSSRRLQHTQDITYDAAVREWQPGKRSTRIDEVPGNTAIPPACDAAQTRCRSLCGGSDGINAVDEVLVVHHEALKKVNFLLRVDELSGCELPTVPECVVAAKQAELQKKHLSLMQAQSYSQQARSRSRNAGQFMLPDAEAMCSDKSLAALDSVLSLKVPLVPKLRNVPQHRAMSPRASPRKEGDEPRSLQNDEDDGLPDQNKLSALVASSALMKGGQSAGATSDPNRETVDESQELQDDNGACPDGSEKGDDQRMLQHKVEALSDDSDYGNELRALQHEDDTLRDDSEKVIRVPLENETDSEGPSSSLNGTQVKM